MTTLLYDKIVEVTEDYLGPASRRFIDRQITFHLQKSPEDVNPEDLDKLTGWIRVSLGLLTDDRVAVDQCIEKLLALN